MSYVAHRWSYTFVGPVFEPYEKQRPFSFGVFWAKKSVKIFYNSQINDVNFSTFQGNFFARKVEVSVP